MQSATMLVFAGSVLLAAIVIPPSLQQAGGQQQYSWMPQGRFGKRFVSKDPSSSPQLETAAVQALLNTAVRLSTDSVQDLPKLNGKLRFAEVPIIQADNAGILCLQTTVAGYYRCFRDMKLGEASTAKK